MHRVVITGAGAVSSLGADLSSNFKSLSEGKSGISTVSYTHRRCRRVGVCSSRGAAGE